MKYIVEIFYLDGRRMQFSTYKREFSLELASLLTKCESLAGVEVYSMDKGLDGSECVAEVLARYGQTK